MKELLNNPVLMAFAGVILGGIVSSLGGFIQSVYNNRHAEKMRELERQYKHSTDIYAKKESAYKKFIVLRMSLLNAQTIQARKSITEQEMHNSINLYSEQLRTALAGSFELLSELTLFGHPDIARKCNEFSLKYAIFQSEQLDELDHDLLEICELMKEDLATYKNG